MSLRYVNENNDEGQRITTKMIEELMSNEEDECDSSSQPSMASQADVDAFLKNQMKNSTGANGKRSFDDDDIRSNRISQDLSRKSSLTQSCFASISSSSDDLTELKWLSTFKLKDSFISDRTSNNTENRIGELINRLKTFDHDEKNVNIFTFAVHLFLAFHSKRNEKLTPWTLTIKQIYEYIQHNFKFITDRNDWKTSLKNALMSIPCFVQIKDRTNKTRSLWTVDIYYRPLLSRAYANNSLLTNDRSLTEENENQNLLSKSQILQDLPPKITMKAKAFPRLFERLNEEKSMSEDRNSGSSKRARSASLLETSSTSSLQHENQLNLALSWNEGREKHRQQSDSMKLPPKKRFSEKKFRQNETDGELENPLANTKESISSLDKTSSSTKKRNTTGCSSHRANTRISRRIIEQDLKLLREGSLSTPAIESLNGS